MPKPMIKIDGRTIIGHIMSKYATHGFRKFVVCAVHKAEVTKDYFLNYEEINSDFTLDIRDRSVTFHSKQ